MFFLIHVYSTNSQQNAPQWKLFHERCFISYNLMYKDKQTAWRIRKVSGPGGQQTTVTTPVLVQSKHTNMIIKVHYNRRTYVCHRLGVCLFVHFSVRQYLNLIGIGPFVPRQLYQPNCYGISLSNLIVIQLWPYSLIGLYIALFFII